MNNFRNYSLIAPIVMMALASCAPANAAVQVTKTSYRGWSNVYRISNGRADLIVAPSIGRILDYRLTGRPKTSPLWINPELDGKGADVTPNEWANFGGEKIWPSPQEDWPARQHQPGNWPPDRQFECGPYTVSRIPNGIRLTGPLVKNYGLRVVRDITMAPHGTRVSLAQRFVKSAGDAFRIGVWSIAQVRSDATVSIPLNPHSIFPHGYTALTPGAHGDPNWKVHGRTLQIQHWVHVDNKLGVDNPTGRLSARYPGDRSQDIVFTIRFHSKTRGAYPDHGSNTEVYNRGDPGVRYLELEALGPLKTLRPGQSVDEEITWELRTVHPF